MGLIVRALGWLWRRWADYNSVVAVLDLLDWKTSLWALFGGFGMTVVGATNMQWSAQAVILAAILAGPLARRLLS